MKTASARAEQLDFYTDLHEGRAPRNVFRQPLKDHPKDLFIGGRITEIQYLKKTDEGAGQDEHHYHHPFAPHARPKFGISDDDALWIYSGRYVVTTHGIEDLPANQVRTERLPRLSPRELTDLGKLEWIKYISNGETRTRMIRFPSRPVLSVDEYGDLHVLMKEKSPMARRRRRSHRSKKHSFSLAGSRKHSKRHARRRHTRSNPSGRSNWMEAIKGAAILGAVATGTLLLADYGLGKYNESRISGGKEPLSENINGAIEIGTGLAGAAIIAKYWRGKMGAVAAAGVGAGGVVSGLKRLYDAYRTRQLAAANNQTTSAGTNPANRALPAGRIPQNYNVRTRESCAAA